MEHENRDSGVEKGRVPVRRFRILDSGFFTGRLAGRGETSIVGSFACSFAGSARDVHRRGLPLPLRQPRATFRQRA
jgi:hypothetical protein